MTNNTITNCDGKATIYIESKFETHCPLCKAEYINHQHPMKPAGVIGWRSCKCTFETKEVTPGVSIITQIPPKAPDTQG